MLPYSVNHLLSTLLLSLLLSLGLGLSNNSVATTISLNIIDAANEGLNDNTAAAPVGGNPGVSIGEQRQIVFEFASRLLENIINSPVTITINAQFNPLFCSASAGTLGSGGPATVHFDNPPFNPFPLANTYYVQALANSYEGFDLSGTNDINMTFNSDIDNNSSCLNNRNWYYGLDGNNGALDIDFLSTVLHEMLHGLGFISIGDPSTGIRFMGRDDVFMRSLEDHSLGQTWNQLSDAERQASAIDDPDLHWIGANVLADSGVLAAGINQGHVRMHAPSTLNPAGSVSHFSSSVSPFELMEPNLTSSVDSIGLAKSLLKDIGWTTFASDAPIVSPIAPMTILNAASTSIGFAFMDNDTATAAMLVTATSSNTAIIDNSGLVLSGTGRLRQIAITPELGMSGMVDITITVNDGANIDTSVFQVTVVSNLPPSIHINLPADGNSYLTSQQNLIGTANDPEDGNISGDIIWTSSIDGVIGNGSNINPFLSDGNHLITASVTDSTANTEMDSINISIAALADNDNDGLNNETEILLGTNPFDSDSDNDFLSDFDEVNLDGDPSNYTVGIDSNPNNDDTDGDGYKDGLDFNPLTVDPPEVNVPLLPAGAAFALVILMGLIANRRIAKR